MPPVGFAVFHPLPDHGGMTHPIITTEDQFHRSQATVARVYAALQAAQAVSAQVAAALNNLNAQSISPAPLPEGETSELMRGVVQAEREVYRILAGQLVASCGYGGGGGDGIPPAVAAASPPAPNPRRGNYDAYRRELAELGVPVPENDQSVVFMGYMLWRLEKSTARRSIL